MFKYELGNRIYQFILALVAFVDKMPNDNLSRTVKDQLIRSATSIGANYMEAQAASSKKDFVNFFNYSLKSANESKFWLMLSKDTGRAHSETVNDLIDEVSQIARILGSSIITARGKKK